LAAIQWNELSQASIGLLLRSWNPAGCARCINCSRQGFGFIQGNEVIGCHAGNDRWATTLA
jgi:hypothetical protein